MNREYIEDRWNWLKCRAAAAWKRVSEKWAGGPDGGYGEGRSRAERSVGEAAPETFGIRAEDVLPALKGLALVGLGAGLMFYADPERGRRRRALVRGRLVRTWHDLEHVLGMASRDLANRTRGLWAGARSLPSRFAGVHVPDEVLVARVRSKLGRYVSHPRAIGVSSYQGRVTLRGPILADEVDGLLAAVFRVPGVAGVTYRLDAHERPGDISGLQGGRPRTGPPSRLSQTLGSPAARLTAGAAGGLLLTAGLLRRGRGGLALGALGAGLVAGGLLGARREWNRNAPGRSAPRRRHAVATGAPAFDVAVPFRPSDHTMPEVGL